MIKILKSRPTPSSRVASPTKKILTLFIKIVAQYKSLRLGFIFTHPPVNSCNDPSIWVIKKIFILMLHHLVIQSPFSYIDSSRSVPVII